MELECVYFILDTDTANVDVCILLIPSSDQPDWLVFRSWVYNFLELAYTAGYNITNQLRSYVLICCPMSKADHPLSRPVLYSGNGSKY